MIVPPPSVASVVVSPTSAKLQVGGTQRFTVTARASDGSSVSGASITWTSSNTAVVSVNTQGLATAVGVGTATIRAVADGVTSAPVTVTVAAPPVASVAINPSSPQQMTVGATRMFAVTAHTVDGSTRDDVEVSWTSSNTAVVSISNQGLATAVGIGTAIIRAVADGVTSSPVMITVTAPPIASVTVNPSSPQQLMVGSTRMFAATARTADGSTRDDVEVSWTSSNTAVVSIDSMGVATAAGIGTAIIRAVADGVTSAPVMISVIAPQVESVTVSPSSPQRLTVGAIRVFAATVRTTDGSSLEDAEVTWTSSNTAVVTIDESGLTTAVGVGTTMIRAVSGGVTSAPVMITVVEPPPVVASIVVSPSTMTMEVGGTFQFEATALTADGMAIPEVQFTWMSDDDGIATVDATGLVTAVAAGTAMITASVEQCDQHAGDSHYRGVTPGGVQRSGGSAYVNARGR